VAAKAGGEAEVSCVLYHEAFARHIMAVDSDAEVGAEGAEEGAGALGGGGASPEDGGEHVALVDLAEAAALEGGGDVDALDVLAVEERGVGSAVEEAEACGGGDGEEGPPGEPVAGPAGALRAEELFEASGLVGEKFADDGATDVGVLVVAEEVVDVAFVALLEEGGLFEEGDGLADVEAAQVVGPLVGPELGAVDEVSGEDEVGIGAAAPVPLEEGGDAAEIGQVALEVGGHQQEAPVG
jgi:hypothetical protein